MQSKESVTVGNQTFIYDEKKGWIDKKTKKPAGDSLVKMLEGASKPLPSPVKEIKDNIDKSVETVDIGGTGYLYDVNKGWVDKKTKKPAPPHLQKIMSDAVGIKPETAKPIELAKVDAKNMGMVGQAAQEKVKEVRKPREKVKDKSVSQKEVSNERSDTSGLQELAAGLSGLTWIMRRKLNTDKDIAKADLETALNREDIIEHNYFSRKKGGSDDSDSGSGSTALMLAAALGGLTLMFDPIKKLLAYWSEMSLDIARMLGKPFNAIMPMTEWMDAFPDAGLKGRDPANAQDVSDAVGFDVNGNKGVTTDKKTAPTNTNPTNAQDVSDTLGFDPNKFTANVTGTSPNQQTSEARDLSPPNPSLDTATPPMPTLPNPTMKDVKKGSNTQSGGILHPVEGAVVSSKFGKRKAPMKGASENHTGIDYAIPQGTPVHAAGSGTVIYAGLLGPNGNLVKIKHDDGSIETRYAHLSKIKVSKGDRVGKGQVIALSGGTPGKSGSGRSKGPHLHFALIKNGKHVNPEKFVGKGGGGGEVYQVEKGDLVDPTTGQTSEAKKLNSGNLAQFIEGLGNITTFDTDYKPWVSRTPEEAAKIQKASMDKKMTEGEIRATKGKQSIMITNNNRSNLNSGGGSASMSKTTTDGNKVIRQYLDYFALI